MVLWLLSCAVSYANILYICFVARFLYLRRTLSLIWDYASIQKHEKIYYLQYYTCSIISMCSKTRSFSFLQTLKLNWVYINNAQCTWWLTPKKLQQRTATEELSITWCSRDLNRLKTIQRFVLFCSLTFFITTVDYFKTF